MNLHLRGPRYCFPASAAAAAYLSSWLVSNWGMTQKLTKEGCDKILKSHLARKDRWLIDCVIRIKGICLMILAKDAVFSLVFWSSLAACCFVLSLSTFWLPVSFPAGACNRLVRRSLHLLTPSIASISILAKLTNILILPLFPPPSKASPTPTSALQSCCCCMSSDLLAVLFHLISELPRSFGLTCKIKVDNPILGMEVILGSWNWSWILIPVPEIQF